MQKLKRAVKKITAITAIGALAMAPFLAGCSTESQMEDKLEDAKITCGEGTVLSEDGKVCEVLTPAEAIVPEMVDEEVQVFNELWSEDYDFNHVIIEQLGDNKVVKLMDDKVEVDGEDYDVAEYLSFSWADNELKFVTSSVADKEMEGDSYLHVGEGSIRYEYRFEDALPELAKDEDVTIKFLGKDLKVVSFSDGEVTVKEGKTESVSIDGSVGDATVIGISEDLVKVKVGEETVYLHEGDTETVNGVEVSVDSIFYVAEKEDREAELTVGKDILRTIKTGDSYDQDVDEDDAEWVYDIRTRDISETGEPEYVLDEVAVVYNQRRDDVDEDSDFKALAVGDELVLPNDYLRVLLEGTNEPNYLSINLYDKDDGVHKLVGNFVYDVVGSEDYEKVYLFNGEFFEDFDHTELIGTELKLDDTEATLIASVDVELVEHLTLNVGKESYDLLHLDTKFVEDEVVKTPYGVKFVGSEDWVEDESDKLTVKVPEEQLEGNLVVGEEVTETVLVPKEEVEEVKEEVLEE